MQQVKFSDLKIGQVFGYKEDELNRIRCQEFDIPSRYPDHYPPTRVNCQQLDGRFARQGYFPCNPDTTVFTFGQIYEYGADIIGVHKLAPGQTELFEDKEPQYECDW
jgi:hypothetical protein